MHSCCRTVTSVLVLLCSVMLICLACVFVVVFPHELDQFEVWAKEVTGNDKMVGGIATSFMGWIGKGSFEGDLDLKDDKVP